MKKATFTTSHSEYKHLSGQEVQVIGPVAPDKFDIEEVGPMFVVRFEDGQEVDVYEDELSPIHEV